jgi:hypothetical protein
MSAASGSANWTKRSDKSWHAPDENQSGAWSGSWQTWDSSYYKNRDDWKADYGTSSTKDPYSVNVERAEHNRRWTHPKHTGVHDLDLQQRPTTPERNWAAPEEPRHGELPPSESRFVSPLGASQRERVAGEKVWYEHDRDGTVMVTEEPNGKESRKRVSASPTAAVTPSRQTCKPLYTNKDGGGFFHLEGYQCNTGKE